MSSMQKIEEQLKQFGESIVPSKEWKEANRALLLARLKEREFNNETLGVWNYLDYAIFLCQKRMGMIFLVKAAVVVMSLSVILGGGSMAQEAARDSVPGDKLYFVKKSLERAQIQMASGSEAKLRLEMAFIEERIKEVRKLTVQKAVSKKKELTPLVIKGLKANVDSLQNRLKEIKEESPSSELRKFVDQRADAASQTLKVVKQEIKDGSDIEEGFLVSAAIDSIESMKTKPDEELNVAGVNVNEEQSSGAEEMPDKRQRPQKDDEGFEVKSYIIN